MPGRHSPVAEHPAGDSSISGAVTVANCPPEEARTLPLSSTLPPMGLPVGIVTWLSAIWAGAGVVAGAKARNCARRLVAGRPVMRRPIANTVT